MLKKFLKVAFGSIAGKPAEDLVDLLDTKKYVNEFIIAKKLDLTINQTRNVLYKISDHGLVSSIRKKDKKKGWYTYFWKIEVLKALEFLRNSLIKRRESYEHQLKSRETKRFYVCDRCHIELSEENAMLYDFTCNECGDLLALKDNTKLVNEIRKNIDRLNKELSLIDNEIEKEEQVIEKKRVKVIKKLEREHTAMLKKRREERAKVRAKKGGKKTTKVIKKTPKKSAKKKTKGSAKTKHAKKKPTKKTPKKITKVKKSVSKKKIKSKRK